MQFSCQWLPLSTSVQLETADTHVGLATTQRKGACIHRSFITQRKGVLLIGHHHLGNRQSDGVKCACLCRVCSVISALTAFLGIHYCPAFSEIFYLQTEQPPAQGWKDRHWGIGYLIPSVVFQREFVPASEQ